MSKVQWKQGARPRARRKIFVVSLSFLGILVAVPVLLAPSSRAAAEPQFYIELHPTELGAYSYAWDLEYLQGPPPGAAAPSALVDTSAWLGANAHSHVGAASPAPIDQPAKPDRTAALIQSDTTDPLGSLASPGAERMEQYPTSEKSWKVGKPDIFGSLAITAPNMPLATNTRRAFALDNNDPAASGKCEALQAEGCLGASRGVWSEVLEEARRRLGIERIEWVNRQVNLRLQYADDQAAHAVADYWSPAHETMLRQSGDCEDFAILKMWLLERLGYDAADMFVVAVQSPQLAAQHAILAVRHGDGFLVLDNLSNKIRESSDVDNYKPMFSVNPKGFWIHGFPAMREVASVGQPLARTR